MKNYLLAALFVVFMLIAQGADLPVAKPDKTTKYGNMAPFSKKRPALSFMENVGQVTDQNHQQRTDIQYMISASPRLSIFVGNAAIHYQFRQPDVVTNSGAFTSQSSFSRQGKLSNAKAINHVESDYLLYRMDVELAGANRKVQTIAGDEQEYFENYSTLTTGGKSSVAHSWRRITYKNIYNNIDWVIYVRNGELEQEFVVKEGGKVSDIQLKYGGATGLKIDEDGSLTASTPQGIITEQAPTCYQADGKPIKSNFKLNGETLSYETSNYKGVIVVDPALQWGTYFGGIEGDYGYGIGTDLAGNVFITGNTSSPAGIATTGAYQTVLSNELGGNVFLAKFNSAGTIQWGTYYGGNNLDQAYGMATDKVGNAIIVGQTYSTMGIATPGAYDSVGDPNQGKGFVAKFSGAGALLWGTYYAGSGGYVNDAATDSSGNLFLTGGVYTSGLATSGAHQTTIADSLGGDAFLAKLNGAGALQWATYYGGGDTATAGSGIATDDTGNIFITGNTLTNVGIATPSAYQTTGDTVNGDAFLAKFNGAGVIQWGNFGGPNSDYGNSVATDQFGNVVITGLTYSTTSIATPGAYQTVGNDSSGDVFLAKFNGLGAIQWATYYGGAKGQNAWGVATCDSGNIYITGNTYSSSGIATNCAYKTINSDTLTGVAYLANFGSAGVLQWATYYAGDTTTIAYAVATDTSGNIYFTGNTISAAGIATIGAYQTVIGDSTNGGDAFLVKFSNCTPLPPVPTISLSNDTLTCSTACGYQWYLNNAPVNNAQVNQLVITSDGAYTVAITESNGCQNTSNIFNVSTLGIQPAPGSYEVRLYPNPNSGQFRLELSDDRPRYVSITDLTGRVVLPAQKVTGSSSFNFTDLSDGVYLLQIKDNDSLRTLRVEITK